MVRKPALLAAVLLMMPWHHLQTARAHQTPFPTELLLRIDGAQVVLIVRLEQGAGENAQTLREMFDANRDGVLDASEQRRLARYFEQRARQWLELEVDGAPLVLKRRERRLGGDTSAHSARPLVMRLDLAGNLLPRKTHTIVLRDRNGDRRVPVRALVIVAGHAIENATQGPPKNGQIANVILTEKVALSFTLR